MLSRPRTRAAVVLPAVALGALLTGCSDIYYDRRDSIAFDAGDAMATNRVTHMVDPWSRASGNRNIAFNGERMQAAVERHRTRKIIRPVNPLTTGTNAPMQPPPDYTTEEVKSSGPNTQPAPVGGSTP